MRNKLRVILLAGWFSLLAFPSCKYDLPPATAGSVELRADGKIARGELAPFQLEGLATWFQAHRTGWEFKVEDRAPELSVHLRSEGATRAVVEIGLRQIAVKNHARTLTPEEHSYLVTLLASFLAEK